MESLSLQNKVLISHILKQLIDACDLIIEWNQGVTDSNDYPTSSEGMQKLAASCMLIEGIGEGVKKIDRIAPGFLIEKSPNTPWKNIMGLRDHIAHGYFNLDADIIFDVVVNEIPTLKETLIQLKTYFKEVLQ